MDLATIAFGQNCPFQICTRKNTNTEILLKLTFPPGVKRTVIFHNYTPSQKKHIAIYSLPIAMFGSSVGIGENNYQVKCFDNLCVIFAPEGGN